MKRTPAQNRALHLWISWLADELNSKGLDMKIVLKPEIDIMWTDKNVKEYLWRPIQKALYDKKSTTELETTDIDKIIMVISKHLGERFGLTIPFPCWEDVLLEEDCNDSKGDCSKGAGRR